MKWLDKICKVLANPKYKNTPDSWVVKNKKGTPIIACALGELLLQSPTKKWNSELTSHTIRRCLVGSYKVPTEKVDRLFTYINGWNSCGKSKQTIAKLLKKQYKK